MRLHQSGRTHGRGLARGGSVFGTRNHDGQVWGRRRRAFRREGDFLSGSGDAGRPLFGGTHSTTTPLTALTGANATAGTLAFSQVRRPRGSRKTVASRLPWSREES